MGSDLTELSKEELIKHIETLNHNIDVAYKDKCENYINKENIRDIIEDLEVNILNNEYANNCDKDIAENQIDVLKRLLGE